MNAFLRAPLVYWSAGGPLLLPLAGACFGIWFLFLRSRRRLALEAAAADKALARLGWGLPPARDGEVADLLHEALAAPAGITPAAHFDALSEQRLRMLRRDMGLLGALTVVAPLIGLLGTVMGMIATFEAVSVSGGDTARRVADGVSRALITTQAGLVIAIPGVFGTLHLRRLLSRLQVRFGSLRLHVFEMSGGRRA